MRVRAPIPKLQEGVMILDAKTGHYLGRVLRLSVGTTITAFDPVARREADAEIEQNDENAFVVQVGPLRHAAIIADREITFIQGLAKGDKCDAIVRDATELGTTSVIVATTTRSIVRLDEARLEERRTRWERIAQEAARQCGRGDPPSVGTGSWQDALAQVKENSRKFCLYEKAEIPLGPALIRALESAAPIAFAVGPEGGLTDEEVMSARRAGWDIVSLGSFVLRTETVAAAVLGAVRIWG